MAKIKTITITPNLPRRLSPLLAIANNLWWTWTPAAIYLFQDMDREVWERAGHNPVAMLGMIEQPKLELLEKDEVFLARMNEVAVELERYLTNQTWYEKKRGKDAPEERIAYFSAEFGLHESLPLYSGGLGILAGDHVKSASDLGLPLVGVGLLYKHGYFQQYLNPDGWQMERYPSNDFYNMPITPFLDDKGEPIIVYVQMENRQVGFRIWSFTVGRVEIIWLDTDIPQNSPADRSITSYLYGGDVETRLQQEIVLGMGGIKALEVLGKTPSVCHMNEGHSAFMAVQRLLDLVEKNNLSFDEALEGVRGTSVFTTHTPVPAGIDYFPPDMIRRYFTDISNRLGIGIDRFLGLGRINPYSYDEEFCMAVLAIKTASQTNGVSKLHGEVSRRMWANLWPQIPKHEVPITHITNGIHTQSWLSGEMARLYSRYLGPKWIDEPTKHEVWKRVELIPPFELWRCRERSIETLITFARSRLKQQLIAKGASSYQIKLADEVLDPEALTIGFARRFATYKRATLLFRDPERLERILTNPDKPVQIIISGKAHPKDKEGKELIHQVFQMSNRPALRKHIVFLENYEFEVARNMVQGVDIWLNTPRRPNEASGTSGMKATVNGCINLSTVDGWWVEGYKGNNGWAIGAGEDYTDIAYQDEVEGRLLYELLENSVVPMFYNRNGHGIPEEWVDMMKNSIKTNCPFFNTNRMVEEYAKHFYLPNSERWAMLSQSNWQSLKELTVWKQKVMGQWQQVKIIDIQVQSGGVTKVGDRVPIRVFANLGGLSPDEVRFEAYIGRMDHTGNIPEGHPLPMLFSGEMQGDLHVFTGSILCLSSGQIGFAVRCYPYRSELGHKFELGLLTWH